MPTFEFECLACGEQFQSLILPMWKDEPIECPKCKTREVNKMPSVCYYGRIPNNGGSVRPMNAGAPAYKGKKK